MEKVVKTSSCQREKTHWHITEVDFIKGAYYYKKGCSGGGHSNVGPFLGLSLESRVVSDCVFVFRRSSLFI